MLIFKKALGLELTREQQLELNEICNQRLDNIKMPLIRTLYQRSLKRIDWDEVMAMDEAHELSKLTSPTQTKPRSKSL